VPELFVGIELFYVNETVPLFVVEAGPNEIVQAQEFADPETGFCLTIASRASVNLWVRQDEPATALLELTNEMVAETIELVWHAKLVARIRTEQRGQSAPLGGVSIASHSKRRCVVDMRVVGTRVRVMLGTVDGTDPVLGDGPKSWKASLFDSSHQKYIMVETIPTVAIYTRVQVTAILAPLFA
jgi:hypothetical protein